MHPVQSDRSTSEKSESEAHHPRLAACTPSTLPALNRIPEPASAQPSTTPARVQPAYAATPVQPESPPMNIQPISANPKLCQPPRIHRTQFHPNHKR
ncbi:hypothetical protein A0H81_11432 [Grifola frondosa]|uniref:Uncharacterized protein n=1 Tax=Grifola frondosa TaxID=5627 RepID=A0A1C7LWK3_GRIFR|nr:hypothetical protein A0H81_11432 [Grifola frondosa]